MSSILIHNTCFIFSAKRRIARCVKRYKQLADQNNTQGIQNHIRGRLLQRLHSCNLRPIFGLISTECKNALRNNFKCKNTNCVSLSLVLSSLIFNQDKIEIGIFSQRFRTCKGCSAFLLTRTIGPKRIRKNKMIVKHGTTYI